MANTFKFKSLQSKSIAGGAGTFTTLSANNGTLTASAPVLDLAQTWNDAAVAFTAINLDITNTASAFGSQFLQFSIAGVPQVRFQRNFSTPVLYFGNSDTGIGSSSTTLSVYANGGATASFGAGGGGMNLRSDSPYSWASSTNLTAANDLSLFRDAADTLAQRRTTNPQTFRIYNTFTDASNYERGKFAWESNVLRIGTEKDGTGSARALEFQTDGVTRVTISTAGTLTTTASIVAGNNVGAAGTGNFSLAGRLLIRSTANASAYFSGVGSQDSNFDLLGFGGTTSSFPALKRDTTTLQVRLADDSAFAPLAAGLTTLDGGTVTASAPVLDLAQTWNDAAVTFTGLKVDATDTASATNSLLLQLQTGGTDRFSVNKAGRVSALSLGRDYNSQWIIFNTPFGSAIQMGGVWFMQNNIAFGVNASLGGNSGALQLGSGQNMGWSSAANPHTANADLRLFRDAADTLAQRRTTNPQTFRLYTTYGGTGGADFERLFIKGQTGGAFQIGTEKGGTGGARALEFQTDGTTQLTIDTGGTATFRTSVKLCENTPNGSVTMISGRIAITSPQTGTMILGTGTNALETRYIARRFSSGAGANFEQAFFGWSGTDILLTAQAGGSGELRGIKLGSASTDLLGFFGATPVDQPALTADLLDSIQALGLVASGSGDTPLNLSGGTLTAGGGSFTTLSANNGTLTASAPVLDLAQTWNDAAVAFTAINLDITNTASAFGSQFLQFSIAGVPQVRFQRNFSTPVLYFGNSDTGIGSSSTTLSVYANGGATASFGAGGGGMNLRSDSPYSWASSTNLTAANDLSLFRDAADTLAQRRTTNPQTFRIYNTFTDASNYERGKFAWESNVLRIGTEKDGTGSARALEFQTDGVTRVTISTAGTLTTTASIVAGNNVGAAGTGNFSLAGRLLIRSTANASAYFSGVGSQDSNFDLLGFGGTTSSFPALKRDTTTLQVRLADDSAFAPLAAGLTTLDGGTVTASAPVLDLAQTWNDSGTAFTAIKVDITNTASNLAGSKILDFSVGGTGNVLNIYRSTSASFQAPMFEFGGSGVTSRMRVRTGGGVGVNFDGVVGIATSLQLGVSTGAGAGDVNFSREAADTLAMIRSTNPQTFRIYNTYTDASNYERLSLRWASSVAIIGTEKGSVGGSARALELQANGVTKIVIAATGHVTLRSSDTSNGHIVNIDPNTWRYSANGKTLNFGRDYGRAQSYFSADEFVFGTYANVSTSQTGQVVLTRDADNTLAQRNGANGQTFRLYNTFTDASNHERLSLRWASNVAIIGTEKAGTGSARALEFQTDGVTRMTIASSGGTINVGSGAQFGSNGIQVASTASLRFSGGAIGSSSDLWMLRSGSGIIRFATGSSTSTADFNRLQFGGTTSSFPALKRDTTTLQVKLADDSAFTAIAASNLVLTDNDGAQTATFDAQSKLTANRTYDLPDASGTIALTSQISKTYAVFAATDNQPPATAFATLDTRNSIAVLDFDDATDESAVFVSIIPEAASLGSGLKIRLHWMATSATSGDVVWDVSLERMTTDLDSDSFDTIASGTAAANGTSGILTVTEITLTTIDSVTAGDGYRLKVTRDANNGSDTMTGDAELVLAEVRSAA
jgi:uncharacterized phosphosugar-binding protein